MSVRTILLVLGWMLAGLAFCPQQRTIVDAGSGGGASSTLTSGGAVWS